MKRMFLFIGLAGFVALAIFAWRGRRAATVAFASGREAFHYIHKLSTHPRCRNCHGSIVDNRHVPTVGEDLRPHPMNIQTRLTALGMECTGCHQDRNFDVPGMPPGASSPAMPEMHWKMPPPGMIFAPETTPRELCERFLDPERNALSVGLRGGKDDLAKFRKEFMHHVEHDPLLRWSFAPDPGRAPAPGGTEGLEEAMDVWTAWLEKGHGCEEL